MFLPNINIMFLDVYIAMYLLTKYRAWRENKKEEK